MADKLHTKLRDRIIAGVGAAVFLITASALTIAVIYDAVTGKDQAPTTDTSQVAACEPDAAIATNEILPAPEVFKPEGAVTELQTTDLEVGSGAEVKTGDCLQVKYYGTLASDGTMFDENFSKRTLFQLQLGAGQVIQGWDQGLVGMKEGGTRRIVIPSALAYGEQGAGDSIPANADLVFVVKLAAIKD